MENECLVTVIGVIGRGDQETNHTTVIQKCAVCLV